MAKGICKNVREMKYEVSHSSLEIANNQINHTHTQNQRKESESQNKGYKIEFILVTFRGLLFTTNKTTPLSHGA